MRAPRNTNQSNKRPWSSMINTDVCVEGFRGESINTQLLEETVFTVSLWSWEIAQLWKSIKITTSNATNLQKQSTFTSRVFEVLYWAFNRSQWPTGQATDSSNKLPGPVSKYKQPQNCSPMLFSSSSSDGLFNSGVTQTVSPLSALLLCSEMVFWYNCPSSEHQTKI